MSVTLSGEVLYEIGSMDNLPEIRALNKRVFNEDRVINRFDRTDLLILLARAQGEVVGFKIGYAETRTTFYSAKGAVSEAWRRKGIARELLYIMMDVCWRKGYKRLAYDTFPNKNPGMTILGLKESFRITAAGFNDQYRDYRLRFEKELRAPHGTL